jgi:hypothetical protein
MTKETLKRAVLLDDEIKKAKEDVEVLNRISFVSTDRLLIEGVSISLCKELTEKVIRLLVDYKQERIAEWQKELDEL